MGLGVFGGGVEAARFLARYCDSVLVTDLRGESVLAESIAAIDGLPIEYRLEEHRRQDFEHADVVIHSPAVRPDNPMLKAAREHGAEVTMEMSLFIEACPARTVGITGSNGKTTTALLAYEMLCEVMQRAQSELEGKWAEKGSDPVFGTKTGSDPLAKVWLGGNCGEPLINKLEGMKADDVVVLELSSFQLQDWHRIKKSCDISVVTNITPNHLDWHKDMAEYIWAKSAICKYAESRDSSEASAFHLFNADDPGCLKMPGADKGSCYSIDVPVRLSGEMSPMTQVRFSGANRELKHAFTAEGMAPAESNAYIPVTLAERSDLHLPGRFNWSNAVAASAIAFLAQPVLLGSGTGSGYWRKALRRFRGVEHRLEYCGEINGARCFNDSIATTPESTLAALSAFDSGVHLLLGGSEKGLSYDALAEVIAEHPGIKGVYLQGANAGTIKRAIEGALKGVRPQFRFTEMGSDPFPTFDSACDAVFAALEPGDVFLMSPSSASFYEYAPNMRFTNFEHRGRHFKALVKAHTS